MPRSVPRSGKMAIVVQKAKSAKLATVDHPYVYWYWFMGGLLLWGTFWVNLK